MSEKILVFTKNWFGDVVMQTPVLRILKENFPGSRLTVALPVNTSEILANNPFVDEVIPLEGAWHNFSFRYFTRAYVLHRSRTQAFLTWIAGIPVRVGYATKGREIFLTQAIPEPRESLHQTDYFVHLLKASGLKTPSESFSEFYFSEEAARRAEQFVPENRGVIALNPGANWEPKRWPEEYFAEFADQLSESNHYSFIITGAGKDIPLAEKIVNTCKKAKPVSLCGKTTMDELGAVFSRCDCVITGDSGPMHIASSVGARVIALFGPTDSRSTAPRGKGKTRILSESTMQAIRPEQVVKAVETRD